MKLVIGLDGQSSGDKALSFAKEIAGKTEACELIVVYVIEWSPYSFQTAEENAERHKRREKEITTAMERVVTPAVEALTAGGVKARGRVRHGDVAGTIIAIAEEEEAEQIIVSRSSEGGFTQRIFGSATSNLVMSAPIPVTVVS